MTVNVDAETPFSSFPCRSRGGGDEWQPRSALLSRLMLSFIAQGRLQWRIYCVDDRSRH